MELQAQKESAKGKANLHFAALILHQLIFA
jgi:hypothetical protein